MLVCPVCEHQQPQGPRCEVCDKVLVQSSAPDLPSVTVEGLEATGLFAPNAPVETLALAELELNTHRTGPDLPPAPVPELEANRVQVGAVSVEAMADLDLGRTAAEARTPAPVGPVACRFCQHVQAAGLLCERCGMRLPRARPAEAAPAMGSSKAIEWTRCRSCGAPAKVGQRCGDCGRDVPPPTP